MVAPLLLRAWCGVAAVVVPVIRELSEAECVQDVLCVGTMPEVHLQPGVMFVGEAQAAVVGNGKLPDADVSFDGRGVPWGLDCIDQQKHSRCKPDEEPLSFLFNGSGVVVYSLDTGVNCRQLVPQYASCTVDADAAAFDGADSGLADLHGHGTAMARIASTLAAGAQLVGVPVLNSDGKGSLSRVLYGLHRVAVLHANVTGPGVVLAPLSTGTLSPRQLAAGGVADLINQAIGTLNRLNVVTVVSAGNENLDACTVAPASAPNAVTVAALLRSTKMAKFSNWGPCADVFAPADAVTGGKSFSGTSVSAAFAAGVAATIASSHTHITAAQVARTIAANASNYNVKRAKGTPPLFVHAPRSHKAMSKSSQRTYKIVAILVVAGALTIGATKLVLKQLPPLDAVADDDDTLLQALL
jgi:subtilisin family serine protease